MNKATTANSTPQNVDYEAEIDRYIAQMKQINGQLSESQSNIEHLRGETRAMLAEINATLDKWAAA